MRIDMLTSGLQQLQAQAADRDNKITFTHFAFGDSRSFTFNASANYDRTGASGPAAEGAVLCVQSASRITFNRIDADQITLHLLIDRDQPEGIIGNVVLYTTRLGVEVPFAIIRNNSPDTKNIKLQSTGRSFGMDLYIHVLLRIRELLTRISTANLVEETVEFKTVTDETTVPWEITSQHDQMLINKHGVTGDPVFAVKAHGLWMGCPFVYTLDDPRFGHMSGGTMGDHYKNA